MVLFHIIGIDGYPEKLQGLCLKYACLRSLISVTIYLSFAWIALWYLKFLSFTEFGIVMALGNITGILLDYPLGLLTDKIGQKVSYVGALFMLAVYYLGMIYAQTFLFFLVLHLIVGVYYALLSGTITTWFMNAWEVHIRDYRQGEGGNYNIGGAMANIGFLNSMIISVTIFCGGISILFFGSQNVSDLFAISTFLTQAGISVIGIFLALRWMKHIQMDKPIEEKTAEKVKKNGCIREKVQNITGPNFIVLIIIFLGFSFMFSAVSSFDEFIVAPTLSQAFLLTAFYISNFRAGNKLTNSISSRFSARFTSKFRKISPVKIVIIFCVFLYLIVWVGFALVVSLVIPVWIGLLLFLFFYYFRSILSGLIQAPWWDVYSNILESKRRSSQESLYNTLYMIITGISYGVTGVVIDIAGFVGAFLFFTLCGIFGIFLMSTVVSNHYKKMAKLKAWEASKEESKMGNILYIKEPKLKTKKGVKSDKGDKTSLISG